MANTVIQYVWETIQSWADTQMLPFQYPSNVGDRAPYAYMFEITSIDNPQFLCNADGGESVMQFGYVSTDPIDCVETLETIKAQVKALSRTSDAPISIYNVSIANKRDLNDSSQNDAKIYHRIFEATFLYEKAV